MAVSESVRGKGISKLLTKFSLDVAKLNGYELAVIECTGFFSHKAALSEGFVPICEMEYTDYVLDHCVPFEDVPPPHSKWVILEKYLI